MGPALRAPLLQENAGQVTENAGFPIQARQCGAACLAIIVRTTYIVRVFVIAVRAHYSESILECVSNVCAESLP